MANEELLQKLRRQRLRMGEDPLPVQRPLDQTKERRSRRDELINLIPLENRGEVKQRAQKFQNADSPGPSPSRAPGRINLETCWKLEKSCPSQKSPGREVRHPLQEVVVQQQAKPENALATIQEEAKSGSLGESVISQEANMAEGPLPSQTEPSPAANPTPSAYTELEGGSIQEILPDMQDITAASLDAEASLARAPANSTTAEAAEAKCFCMWDSDEDDDCLAQDDLGSARSAAEAEAEEPLEFSMLDYLAELPEGVTEKLQRCLKTHEELVQKLCHRNELLQAHVRNIRSDGQGKMSPNTPNRCKSPPFSPISRKSPQVGHASNKAAPKDVSKLMQDSGCTDAVGPRDEHELIEANLRARLQRTIKASKERVQAMQRRVEREEQQVRSRFEVAMQTREGLERSIKAALKEHSLAKVRVAELEEAVGIDAARCRAKEKEHEQLVGKQARLRNELKAQRSRVLQHQKCERRIQDLQRELEALTKACHTESPRWAL